MRGQRQPVGVGARWQDPEADLELERLVLEYQHRVGFFAARVQRSYRLGTRCWDDLVSAGYWGLFEALRNRRPDANEWELSAYVSKRIFGAVMDEARQWLARGSETQGAAQAASELPRPGGHGTRGEGSDDPERSTGRAWARSAIHRALDALPAEDRGLVVAYMNGASLAEMATAEGISRATMQVRFQRIARRLRARQPALRRILLEGE